MSKAFTREDDTAPDDSLPVRSALPFGATNYLTAAGAARMRGQLQHLLREERPPLAAAKDDDPEMAARLRRMDQRIVGLKQALESAEIVSPPRAGTDKVQFGATVEVRDANGEAERYRIVGVDEVDAGRGWVSWLSPIAKVLLQHSAGDQVKLRTPSGERALRITRVAYEEGSGE